MHRRPVLRVALGTLTALTLCAAPAARAGDPAVRAVTLIWMGGEDCPSCVAWRALELPKLRQTAAFSRVRFFYVPKVVQASVPPAFFLPDELKPLKDKLDDANAGRAGSPQGAVIVDGEVHDYFLGARSAEDIERMLTSALDGTPYPFRRCLRVDPSRVHRRCDMPAPKAGKARKAVVVE